MALTEKQIHLAILIWNTSLLPKHEQMDSIESTIKTITHNDRELRKDCLSLVDMLLTNGASPIATYNGHPTRTSYKLNSAIEQWYKAMLICFKPIPLH